MLIKTSSTLLLLLVAVISKTAAVAAEQLSLLNTKEPPHLRHGAAHSGSLSQIRSFLDLNGVPGLKEKHAETERADARLVPQADLDVNNKSQLNSANGTGSHAWLRALQKACTEETVATACVSGGQNTVAKCESGSCVYECNDGNACTNEAFDGDGNCVVDVNPVNCDDGYENTIDTCNPLAGCQYECNDRDACTNEAFDGDGNCVVDVNPVNCDDGDDNTIDTCNPTTGCEYECNDGNACTTEAFDGDGNCVVEEDLILCDDEDASTIDVCFPTAPNEITPAGCNFYKVLLPDLGQQETEDETDAENIATGEKVQLSNPIFDTCLYYDDEPDLKENEVSRIIAWLRSEVTQDRTPFCWKQSYGRGFGEVLTACPSPKEKIGALCYSPCQSGYSRQGTFDCQQECKSDWRDDGLFCRKAEYGRGGGYPWKFGDGLNDNGMFQRCEAANGGSGKCEKYGLVVYPKCRSGYNNFGCCICRPPVPNCGNEGYNTPGLDLSCPVKIVPGDPTPLICGSGLEQDGLLCYPPCRDGYDGVGPVCWQECDTDQVECGAGCAKTSLDCGLTVADQVLAPIIVAANIITLGASSTPAAGARAVTIGSKTAYAASKPAFYMLKFASKFQTVSPANLAKGASLVTRIKLVRAGTKFKKANLARKVAGQLYSARSAYSKAFAEQFEDMTSRQIVATLDSQLEPEEAAYIKYIWADIQLEQMAEANRWAIAQAVLAAASIVDISGITGVASAYAKPKCADVISFPALEENVEPNAICTDAVNVAVSQDSNCEALVGYSAIDNESYDPDGDFLEIVLSAQGQATSPGVDFITVDASSSSYTATMTVFDRDGASDTCTGTVSVTDPTPPSIACPWAVGQATDLGTCSAVVAYMPPVVTGNCFVATPPAEQVAGRASLSSFDEGITLNKFEVTDASGQMADCTFEVTVNDLEPPALSCAGLAVIKENDAGLCSAVYTYAEPVATDNCEGVAMSKTEGTEFDDPFPVGTTTTTYEASDPSGNFNSCSFDVTILDREPPALSCNGLEITKANDSGMCGAVHEYAAPVCTDNCFVCETDQTAGFPSASFFPVGTATNTFESRDPDDNKSTCDFLVIIEDRELPSVSCEIGVNPAGKPAKSAKPGFFEIRAADNCEIAMIELVDATGHNFGNGFVDGDLIKYDDDADTAQIEDGSGVLNYKIDGTGDLSIVVTDVHGNVNTAVCSRGTGT